MEGAVTGKLWLFEQILGKFNHASAFPPGHVKPFSYGHFYFSEGGKLPPGKVMTGCSGILNPVLCSLWPGDHHPTMMSAHTSSAILCFTLSFSLMVVT